ncbi:Eukaryotic translation initiation factor 4 gamma 3 [Eumeta japonica]|uniref:Eukaryotic translation initiation factor 4 gamma 3 n=1 Tax=Eumeta variegata TaxID=151549 RepID=A0A4C1XTW3_EUMVA|nr:Eukaryotic translation initiation factor 4 gamma 3 [Eumeta japonica]
MEKIWGTLFDRELERPVYFGDLPHPAHVPQIRFESVEKLDSHTLNRLAVVGPPIYTDGSRIECKVGAVRSALKVLTGPKTYHPLAHETRRDISEIVAEGKAVRLFWVKANARIAGNHRANELARRAAFTKKTAADCGKFPLSYAKKCDQDDEPGGVAGAIRQGKHCFKLKDSPYCTCNPAKIQDVLHVLEECDMCLRGRAALEAESASRLRGVYMDSMLSKLEYIIVHKQQIPCFYCVTYQGQILSNTKLAPQNSGWVHGVWSRSPHTPAANATPPPAPAPLSNKYSLLPDSDDAPAPALAQARGSSNRSRSNDDERPREPPRSAPAPVASRDPHPVDEPVAAVSSATDSSLQTKYEQKKSELKCEDPFELKKARIKSTIDQFLITSDAEEVGEELRRLYPPQQHAALVAEILNAALEKSLKETVKIAQLILTLVNTKALSESTVEEGLREIMEFASDIVIDVPKLYDYIACFVSVFIQNEIFSLATLYDMSSGVISAQQGRLLLKSVLRLLVTDRGEAFVSDRWRGSGLTLRQWMNNEQVESFIVENSLHFLKCDDIKNEIPASDSTDLDKNSNSTDKETSLHIEDRRMHIEVQTNNEGAHVLSDEVTSRPPSETHSNLIDSASSYQSLNDVQSDRPLQIHNVIVNENANSNAVASDVYRDENLNMTEKCDSVRIDSKDNTSDPVVIVKTEVERTCDVDNKSIRIEENTVLSQNDNKIDSDVNSDENFNRLESCDLAHSKDDNSARSKDEKSLCGLENTELEPSCSEDLNGIDNFSSESDAAEERNELCLEERLLAYMEAGERSERLLEWLESRKSRRPNDKTVVARALTRALCRYALAGSRRAPEDLFDEVRLQRYQDLLKSFDVDRQHGLDCVIGVQDLMQRKPQHHEALLSVLQYLLEEKVVPLDALQAYEQFVNAQTLD